MSIGFRKGALAFGLVSGLALATALPVQSAPVTSGGTALLKQSLSSDVTAVQYRRHGGRRYHGPRHHGGGAAIAGVAAGIIGLGIAAATAPRYYYEEPDAYYYEAPPAYYAPRSYPAPRCDDRYCW